MGRPSSGAGLGTELRFRASCRKRPVAAAGRRTECRTIGHASHLARARILEVHLEVNANVSGQRHDSTSARCHRSEGAMLNPVGTLRKHRSRSGTSSAPAAYLTLACGNPGGDAHESMAPHLTKPLACRCLQPAVPVWDLESRGRYCFVGRGTRPRGPSGRGRCRGG